MEIQDLIKQRTDLTKKVEDALLLLSDYSIKAVVAKDDYNELVDTLAKVNEDLAKELGISATTPILNRIDDEKEVVDKIVDEYEEFEELEEEDFSDFGDKVIKYEGFDDFCVAAEQIIGSTEAQDYRRVRRLEELQSSGQPKSDKRLTTQHREAATNVS